MFLTFLLIRKKMMLWWLFKFDRAAVFNRIYGLYANGVSFIREDILSKGNQDQIHEALDHLRLKPTGLGYEELKKIQYYGDLRSLITKLSHKTIKEKLLFKLYGEEEALRIINGSTQESIKGAIMNAILKQLGNARSKYEEQINRFQNEEIFYDQVTREMVRNKVKFIRAVDIANEMNAVLTKKQNQEGLSSPISSSDTGGIDFSNIELTLKDGKFVLSLNPADLKILRAARALKEGQDSLAVLYIHEVRLILKDRVISERYYAKITVSESFSSIGAKGVIKSRSF